jgi:hypothetical protein
LERGFLLLQSQSLVPQLFVFFCNQFDCFVVHHADLNHVEDTVQIVEEMALDHLDNHIIDESLGGELH